MRVCFRHPDCSCIRKPDADAASAVRGFHGGHNRRYCIGVANADKAGGETRSASEDTTDEEYLVRRPVLGPWCFVRPVRVGQSGEGHEAAMARGERRRRRSINPAWPASPSPGFS